MASDMMCSSLVISYRTLLSRIPHLTLHSRVSCAPWIKVYPLLPTGCLIASSSVCRNVHRWLSSRCKSYSSRIRESGCVRLLGLRCWPLLESHLYCSFQVRSTWVTQKVEFSRLGPPHLNTWQSPNHHPILGVWRNRPTKRQAGFGKAKPTSPPYPCPTFRTTVRVKRASKKSGLSLKSWRHKTLPKFNKNWS
jgi:hypothetical protein